jgi:hypothetical protein
MEAAFDCRPYSADLAACREHTRDHACGRGVMRSQSREDTGQVSDGGNVNESRDTNIPRTRRAARSEEHSESTASNDLH